jgi:hypothetical protein
VFEDLDEAGLELCRRVLDAVGFLPGMVTVLVDEDGQLPGPTVSREDWFHDQALPDVRSPWTQRALLEVVRAHLGDGSLRILPLDTGYVLIGASGVLSAPGGGYPSPERVLVAALDPDGEPEEVEE